MKIEDSEILAAFERANMASINPYVTRGEVDMKIEYSKKRPVVNRCSPLGLAPGGCPNCGRQADMVSIPSEDTVEFHHGMGLYASPSCKWRFK